LKNAIFFSFEVLFLVELQWSNLELNSTNRTSGVPRVLTTDKKRKGRIKSYDRVSMETYCHTDTWFHPFQTHHQMTISEMLKKCIAAKTNHFCGMNITMKYREIYYLVRRLWKNKK